MQEGGEGMRRMEFRAKRAETGDWVYGYYTMFSSGFKAGTPCIETVSEDYDVLSDTVGQYTLQRDINGVDIYEGDIVKAHMDFGPGGFRELIIPIHWAKYGWPFDYFDMDTIEVIGNIHDNPELLKEVK